MEKKKRNVKTKCGNKTKLTVETPQTLENKTQNKSKFMKSFRLNENFL